MNEKKLLGLSMITKNAGEILRRCLKENKKHIDYWAILDTGSTDNTKEIIREELKDIPGTLFESEFQDFSQARNKALELSLKHCKYTIILDDSYELIGGEKLRELLQNSKNPCFSIRIGNLQNNFLQNEYLSNRIIKTSENLRYKYRVHEQIDISKKQIQEINDPDIFINDIETMEHKNRSVARYIKDIKLLLQDHENYPNNPRIIYYLARTYYNMENYNESLKFYNLLKKLNNIDDEYYFSADYESACIKYIQNDDIDAFKTNLVKLINIYTKRCEPVYKLAVVYKDEQQLEEADAILKNIIMKPKPKLLYTILESDIYDYFIPYLYIDTKLQLGNMENVMPLLQKLLTMYPSNQPLLNMKYAICGITVSSSANLSNGKTLVIHTGGEQSIFKNWNPKGDKRISGSEIVAMNLGSEFVKLGYRVFIIGSFEDSSQNIDHQCIYKQIEYIDYKYFNEFALKYVIDILIISRYASNLVYYDNIRRVFLWAHDVLPVMDSAKSFQIHKEKFKAIIAISQWQKDNIIKQLNIPEDRIIVSRNAIYSGRFLYKTIKKTPYRFIYSSDATRGLNTLIELIPKIKERYPETTLYIFTNKGNIDYDTLKTIEILDYVFLNDRVSQDQLAIEFLKSDIFFYPTNFRETFCISAVEAMASKCLVVTVKLAALSEIVCGKGILCDWPFRENKEDLLEKLFFVLDKPYLKEHFIEKGFEWSIEQTYEKLAQDWLKFL